MAKTAELKTKKTEASVAKFVDGLPDPATRKDCKTLVGIMKAATGANPKMWGSSIVGFGDYRYESARTGRGGDWFVMGFAPRKANLTLYFLCGLDRLAPQLEKLGKHKRSGGCLHIKTLDDVDGAVLRKMAGTAAAALKRKK
jgi:hypothetical protein